MGLEQQKILRKWRSMTLKEEYQAKVDLANKLLKQKKYTTKESVKSREDIIRLKEIYEYRLEALERREKVKEKEKVSDYGEMLKDMGKDECV